MNQNNFIHESSYIDEDVVIGAGTKVWHFCHIQSGARIGENCSLGQNVNIGNNVIIGNGCKIQNNVSVYEGVELEDYVFCGPSCVFTNDLTPRSKYPKGSGAYLKTVVKRGATIGANSTIVCGNTIGKWAIIGAGAVVTKDVLDYALVTGVPARWVGWVCECGEGLASGSGSTADASGVGGGAEGCLPSGGASKTYVCRSCGKKYMEVDSGLKEK